nr:hypothetical protein [Rhizobium sp. BK251]
MLQTLISLSDQEIELVIGAVREWCAENHCEIDSSEGRRAMTAAVDVLQASPSRSVFLQELSQRMGA